MLSPRHSDDQADHEAPECAGLVAPGPEDGEQVDGADGRRQVAGDGLDVGEELRALRRIDDGDPDDGDHHQHHHEGAPGEQELGLARVLPGGGGRGAWREEVGSRVSGLCLPLA